MSLPAMPDPTLGLVPGRVLVYTWIGDPAVDVERSDVEHWLRTGEGLVCHEGQAPTLLHCLPLDAATLETVWRFAMAGTLRRGPSRAQPDDLSALAAAVHPQVCSLAVAYSVDDVTNGPALPREFAGGAMRLSLASMRYLQGFHADVPGHGKRSLVGHLGSLVLAMSSSSESEGKA